MAEQVPIQPQQDVINVATWNILLDKTRTKKGLIKPQSARLPSQAETLRSLEVDLDVVAIQEAHAARERHGGEELARRLGFAASFWHEHNTTMRRGDMIGVFGRLVEEAEFFAIGHDKLAMLTSVGSVAVVGVHFRNETFGPMRADQAGAVLERLEGEPQAVVMGDFNALPHEKPRRLLRIAGFESAFTLSSSGQPKTWPTRAYRPAFRWVLPALRYDDIYVRGLDVEWARSFTGDSDHKGLVARIAVPKS